MPEGGRAADRLLICNCELPMRSFRKIAGLAATTTGDLALTRYILPIVRVVVLCPCNVEVSYVGLLR